MATLDTALRFTRDPKSELDRLINRVAERVSQAANYLDVRATPPSWPAGPPDDLNGAKPHVSALEWKAMKWREAFWYVVDNDELGSSAAMEICEEISRRAVLGDGSFYLVAPNSMAGRAKDWADRHNIRVTGFWIFSD